jgi:hypothetical protein
MALKNRLYPHLLPADIAIWEAYLELNGQAYIRFDYDVRVGEGQAGDPQLPDEIRKMALDLSMRRIDAVGHRSDAIDIIEITTSAGFKSIGQLLGYPLLYARAFHPMKKLRPLLVCASVQPDIEPVLQANNITVVRVQLPS